MHLRGIIPKPYTFMDYEDPEKEFYAMHENDHEWSDWRTNVSPRHDAWLRDVLGINLDEQVRYRDQNQETARSMIEWCNGCVHFDPRVRTWASFNQRETTESALKEIEEVTRGEDME